ncbi:MAG: hypothetical protein IKR04_04355 [Clostridia bacterium]|nr:hypothetical protein [Clostridia bacterium]
MKIDKSKLFVRKLKEDELSTYMKFVRHVKKNMEHPEWLGEFVKRDYIRMFNNGAAIYIWTNFENMNKKFTSIDQFVACGMLIPARKKDLTKFMQDDLEYKEVVDFGPEMVHPDYIGNGLQMDVLEYLERIAVGQGYKHCLGTVDPENVYSLRNLLKKNFEISTKVELKRGPRLVLRKDL